jgi:SAM-dependent methyltransferase
MDFLVCPECGGGLRLEVFRENSSAAVLEIQDGALLCDQCSTFYVVSHYIPRMLPDHLSRDVDFARRYLIELERIRKTHQEAGGKTKDSLAQLKNATIRNFGFEWKQWSAFGWGDEVSMEKTRKIFDYKVMFSPAELGGKLVLDAGCGNGRYAAVASEYGGEVIGVDLSDAVDVAWENTKNDPKMHIVQGDLFKLPLKKNIFDFIFSNGVLMHTGDARKAFFSIASHLKNDGAITIHLYHKGNPFYEFNDWWLRGIITRIPLAWAYVFSKVLAGSAKILPKKFVYYVLNAIIRIEPHPHYVFDWYTAPIATHHTYPEVYGWLKEAGLNLVADHNLSRYPWRKWILPFFFLTVKAQKQAFAAEISHTIE